MFAYDDKAAIDLGFDYVNFPDLKNEEKIKMLPQIFVEEIEM